MNAKTALIIGAALCGLFFTVNSTVAQGTAFTYQGTLYVDGAPANGLFDMDFSLFETNSGGSSAAGPDLVTAVGVTNGLFTVTLDFYYVWYTPEIYWLDIAVRPTGNGSFVELTPRQQVTPTPYAVFAEDANFANNLPDNSVSTLNLRTTTSPNIGQVLVVVPGGLLGWTNLPTGGGGGSPGWNLTGNSGTVPGVDFVGTTDNAALEMHVNNVRGWQLQPTSDSPNVVAGAPGNFVASGVVGATVAGGGTITLYGAAYTNSVLAYHGTISGGLGNTIQASGYESTIAGGNQNTVGIGAFRSAIGGGYLNSVQSNAYESVIGGGVQNIVGPVATVPGGANNSATGYGSFAAGVNAHTAYDDSFIWSDGTQAANGTGADKFEVLASGGLNFYTKNSVTSILNGNVGINTPTPSQQLEVNGEFMMVDGLSQLQCYVGDDGYGDDVQIGSLVSGVTQVSCYNEADSAYMQLNVSAITIHGGSDLAEPFPISSEKTEIHQGAVVVIDDENPGRLKLSDKPYDSRVAGVVSGANGINPGIQMQQQGLLEGGRNVALTGRVYVQADASNGPIRPGDLLTTSPTPGYAMKVTDHGKAEGAILGKAMGSLSAGKGMVLMLVTLQ